MMIDIGGSAIALRHADKKTPVVGSGLSQRVVNILLTERIAFVENAKAMSDAELLDLHHFGCGALAELRAWPQPC